MNVNNGINEKLNRTSEGSLSSPALYYKDKKNFKRVAWEIQKK
jgi:hypothetical protein